MHTVKSHPSEIITESMIIMKKLRRRWKSIIEIINLSATLFDHSFDSQFVCHTVWSLFRFRPMETIDGWMKKIGQSIDCFQWIHTLSICLPLINNVYCVLITISICLPLIDQVFDGMTSPLPTLSRGHPLFRDTIYHFKVLSYILKAGS